MHFTRPVSSPNYSDTYIGVNRDSYLNSHKSPYIFTGVSELADRLKTARKEAGLSQQELSKAAGIKQPVISDLERGKQQGSSHLTKLAAALGVNAVWLDSGKGPKLSGAKALDDLGASPVSQELLDLSPEELAVVRSVIQGLRNSRKERS